MPEETWAHYLTNRLGRDAFNKEYQHLIRDDEGIHIRSSAEYDRLSLSVEEILRFDSPLESLENNKVVSRVRLAYRHNPLDCAFDIEPDGSIMFPMDRNYTVTIFPFLNSAQKIGSSLTPLVQFLQAEIEKYRATPSSTSQDLPVLP